MDVFWNDPFTFRKWKLPRRSLVWTRLKPSILTLHWIVHFFIHLLQYSGFMKQFIHTWCAKNCYEIYSSIFYKLL
jgi:hypothetical protein